jgi:hypothetical protein
MVAVGILQLFFSLMAMTTGVRNVIFFMKIDH